MEALHGFEREATEEDTQFFFSDGGQNMFNFFFLFDVNFNRRPLEKLLLLGRRLRENRFPNN